MLLAAICVAVTLALVVMLVLARRAMRAEHHGWIESRVDDDTVLWHDGRWDEATHKAALEALRNASGRAGAEH